MHAWVAFRVWERLADQRTGCGPKRISQRGVRYG
jgi:hypothetical protein